MSKTLDLLPAQQPKKLSFGAVIRAAAKLGAANDKGKPQFTVPKMKQLAKLAKSMGHEVTGFIVNADGGFTVTVAEPSKPKGASKNPWDEVLE